MDLFKHKFFICAFLACFIIDCNCGKAEDELLPFQMYNMCIKSIAKLFQINLDLTVKEYCPSDLSKLKLVLSIENAIKYLNDVEIKAMEEKENAVKAQPSVQTQPNGVNLKTQPSGINLKTQPSVISPKGPVNVVKKKKEVEDSDDEEDGDDDDDDDDDDDEDVEIPKSVPVKKVEIPKSVQNKKVEIPKSVPVKKGADSNVKIDLSYGIAFYKSLESNLDPSKIPSPEEFCSKQEKNSKLAVIKSITPLLKTECSKQLKEFKKNPKGPLNHALYNVVLKDFEVEAVGSKKKPKANFRKLYMEEIIATVQVKNKKLKPKQFCDRKLDKFDDVQVADD